ncbi:MAG: hypothetical protein NTX65_16655 [Ignavibacteriales bacterium]|nr:hypothetical protein [Ignavibacteriales bacterium]
MKKIFNNNLIYSSLIGFLLLSCTKIPDGVVDVSTVEYNIVSITAPAGFTYSQTDSAIVTSIQVANYETVSNVWCKVSSIDGTLTVIDQATMYDNGNLAFNGDQIKGDGIYAAKFVMGKLNPNGNYQIEYFIEDNIRQAPENLVKAGVHIFTFNNGQNNLPPVISNENFPFTVNIDQQFTFSVKAVDPNGQSDIDSVYYKLYRPNGTLVINSQGISKFLLFDDGNTSVHGDITAQDRIYSAVLTFPSGQPIGTWRFELQARDRGGKFSDPISHNLPVN